MIRLLELAEVKMTGLEEDASHFESVVPKYEVIQSDIGDMPQRLQDSFILNLTGVQSKDKNNALDLDQRTYCCRSSVDCEAGDNAPTRCSFDYPPIARKSTHALVAHVVETFHAFPLARCKS